MKYFAYGANINKDRFKNRCPDSVFVESIILDNYSFFINSRGVSSVKEQEGKFVQGLSWEISVEDEFLLDLYEGVEQGFYTKQYLFIKNEKYLVYLATDVVPGVSRIGYLEDIIDNAKKQNFQEPYIKYLESL